MVTKLQEMLKRADKNAPRDWNTAFGRDKQATHPTRRHGYRYRPLTGIPEGELLNKGIRQVAPQQPLDTP